MDTEEEFDAEVTVERTADTRGREATAEFTVYCDPDSKEDVRERVAGLEADVAFDTFQ